MCISQSDILHPFSSFSFALQSTPPFCPLNDCSTNKGQEKRLVCIFFCQATTHSFSSCCCLWILSFDFLLNEEFMSCVSTWLLYVEDQLAEQTFEQDGKTWSNTFFQRAAGVFSPRGLVFHYGPEKHSPGPESW